MKKILLLMTLVIASAVLLSSCKTETTTYLFHFTTSFKWTDPESGAEAAIQEIQAKVDLNKIFTYETTRDKAISSAKSEFDKVIGTITKDYSSSFSAGEFVTIGMTMFAPETYVVSEKTWGKK